LAQKKPEATFYRDPCAADEEIPEHEAGPVDACQGDRLVGVGAVFRADDLAVERREVLGDGGRQAEALRIGTPFPRRHGRSEPIGLVRLSGWEVIQGEYPAMPLAHELEGRLSMNLRPWGWRGRAWAMPGTTGSSRHPAPGLLLPGPPTGRHFPIARRPPLE
jgi:hypothetical protein